MEVDKARFSHKQIINMKKFLYSMFILPSALCAQQNGIQFESKLNWSQIQTKAKAENKMVFVDCYATWCGPCRVMEQEVYTHHKIGTFFNDKFISVKVQQDKTPKDNEMIRSWYSDAEKIMREYKVTAFPTFLFFTADGKLVHRAAGGYKVEGFLEIAEDALTPQKQYYTQLANFQQGMIDTSVMRQLAINAKLIGDGEIARQIAQSYIKASNVKDLVTPENLWFINEVADDKELAVRVSRKHISDLSKKELATQSNILFILDAAKDEVLAKEITDVYINGLSEQELYTKDNIEFISSVTRCSSAKSFQILYQNKTIIDKLMGIKNFSQVTIDYVISKEEVLPILLPNQNNADFVPDWRRMTVSIAKKYNDEDAKRVIVKAKVGWYGSKQDWTEFTKNLVAQLDLTNGNGLNGYTTNNDCWTIFERSSNKKELTRALYWMDQMFKAKPEDKGPTTIDTYANLLYKVGKKDKALEWQEKAVQIENENAARMNFEANRTFQETLDKMKSGEPTWSQD